MVLNWIRFLGLPSHLYRKQILWEIGGIVGKVTKLDFNAFSRVRGVRGIARKIVCKESFQREKALQKI
ncbi:hypothetical protein PVK06_020930 [Gossypium arboreum]|uniref:DUF4283 domain-containing protein n=1 Tax=Gossypium arboreum TaxID=29729 RepID=A0ABR0PNM5_GOSAR|nr:hypothetical protein PVK06_020930 [Gossypium arboreum]